MRQGDVRCGAPTDWSDAQVTELLNHAVRAWDRLDLRKRVARFEWGGRRYRAVHTGFRLQVQSANGYVLFAYRWDDQ